MMKPVCTRCQRFFTMKKTGYYFVEAMPTVNRAPKGTEAPELWRPYKIWSGDLWECEGCHVRIVSGTGAHPLAEHYQPDFQEKLGLLGADQLQVNDC